MSFEDSIDKLEIDYDMGLITFKEYVHKAITVDSKKGTLTIKEWLKAIELYPEGLRQGIIVELKLAESIKKETARIIDCLSQQAFADFYKVDGWFDMYIQDPRNPKLKVEVEREIQELFNIGSI